VSGRLDWTGIARACGYPFTASVHTLEGLEQSLQAAKAGHALAFIEVKCALGSRADLGRPVEAPSENRAAFMTHLKEDA